MNNSNLVSKIASRFNAAQSLGACPTVGAQAASEDDDSRAQVSQHVGENPEMLDARGLIKPAGLAKLSYQAVFYFRKKKAWMVLADVVTKREAERLGKQVQKNLISKRHLGASEPYLYHIPLFVAFSGGHVELKGSE